MITDIHTFNTAFTWEAFAASRRLRRFNTVSGTAGSFEVGCFLAPAEAGAAFLGAILALQHTACTKRFQNPDSRKCYPFILRSRYGENHKAELRYHVTDYTLSRWHNHHDSKYINIQENRDFASHTGNANDLLLHWIWSSGNYIRDPNVIETIKTSPCPSHRKHRCDWKK